MKKFKKAMAITMAAVAACATMGLASCGEDTLVVYTEAGFAPFEYVSKGKIVGVDVDIMNLVGKKLGKKVQFENVGFNTIIDAVSAGKLCNVGAAGISITEERKQKVDFSNEYYTAALYVIYEKDKASVYESTTTDNVTGVYWEAMAGKDIAVQGGTTADLFLGDELKEGATLDKDATGTNATTYGELKTAVADIGLNVDVLIIDELPAKKLIEGKSNLTCAPLYYKGGENENDEAAIDTYAICVTKGQDKLLAAINEVLEELGKDGVQALVDKHLGL